MQLLNLSFYSQFQTCKKISGRLLAIESIKDLEIIGKEEVPEGKEEFIAFDVKSCWSWLFAISLELLKLVVFGASPLFLVISRNKL